MKLAMAQMSNGGSPEINLKKSLDAIHEAAKQGADLLLFPEVQLTEFFPQFPSRDVRKYGNTIDSPVVQAFCSACREAGIYAVPNIYLKEGEQYYDASLVIDRSGAIIGIQKMVHIAQAEQFYEQDYYAPSNEGFQVYDTEFGKLAVTVCFDRHYPESIRTEALMGADLILIPTVNTKSEPLEMFEWELRVQAFHSSVAIAMCNRVGTEADMDFAGESIVVDPRGGVILKADDAEQIVYADLDPKESRKVRNSRPYTTLRRPELYEIRD